MSNEYFPHHTGTDETAMVAHDVLDLVIANGFLRSRDVRLRAWEIAGEPGRWRACVERSGRSDAWHHGPSELAAIEAVRASFPASDVDALASKRRRHERAFDRIARALAILRDAGGLAGPTEGVERVAQRMYLRGEGWSVRAEWSLPLRTANGRHATGHVHASVGMNAGDPVAYVNGATGVDNLLPGSAVEWGSMIVKVGAALSAAMTALQDDGGGADDASEDVDEDDE